MQFSKDKTIKATIRSLITKEDMESVVPMVEEREEVEEMEEMEEVVDIKATTTTTKMSLAKKG